MPEEVSRRLHSTKSKRPSMCGSRGDAVADAGGPGLRRPAAVARGSVPKPPLWRRLRRKSERVWSEYRLARAKRRYRRHLSEQTKATTAFVLGCQRSGTNMLLRTLGRSLDVDKVEETDRRCFGDCRVMDQDTCAALVARSTARCVVFKPICDSHRALELLTEHPGSKAVWIFRSYQDVANSAVRYWGDQTLRFIQDLLQGGGDWGVAQWNREKVTVECVRDLQQAASDGLNPHGAAALFWYMRNLTFFDQELENQSATLLVRYEALVAEPTAEFKRLCEFLDIRFDSGMVRGILAKSRSKQSFPPVSLGVQTLCEGMMKRLHNVR